LARSLNLGLVNQVYHRCEQMLLEKLIAPPIAEPHIDGNSSLVARYGGQLIVDLIPVTKAVGFSQ
jgi:hypothetical protein